jgi:hypothetical protein
MRDFDNATLCYFVFSLLWVVLAGRVSKTTCGGVAEGLFSSGCLFATLSECFWHAWECIRKDGRRANYAGTNTDGQRVDETDV